MFTSASVAGLISLHLLTAAGSRCFGHHGDRLLLGIVVDGEHGQVSLHKVDGIDRFCAGVGQRFGRVCQQFGIDRCSGNVIFGSDGKLKMRQQQIVDGDFRCCQCCCHLLEVGTKLLW